MAAAQAGYYRRSGYYGGSVEKKFLDTSISDASVTAALTATNLNIVVQGDGESERIGRKMTIKNIRINTYFTLLAATAAASTSETVRCMLVQDTQTNGAAFAAVDLLETDVYNSFRNLANQTRFKVLWSRQYAFKAGGAAASGAAFVFSEDVKNIKMSKKCNIVIEFDNSATTGAVTTQRSNSLHWVTLSSTGALTVSVGLCRIRYMDR